MKHRNPDSELDFELVRPRHRQQSRSRVPGPRESARAAELRAPEPVQNDDWPTLSARKAERLWLIQQLGPFRERKVIDDVVERIRTGKEATVYVCTTPTGKVAAKLYHGVSRRSNANQQLYEAGRSVLDSTGRP